MSSVWRLGAKTGLLTDWVVQSYTDSDHIIHFTVDSASLQVVIDQDYTFVAYSTGLLTGLASLLIGVDVAARTVEIDHGNILNGFLLPGDHCTFGSGGG